MEEKQNKAQQNTSVNENKLFTVRKEKLQNLVNEGKDPFRANWDQTHTSKQAIKLFDENATEPTIVSVAGRILAFRVMGKASFLKILDRDGLIQIYVTRDELPEGQYAKFKKLDIGDIIGIKGHLFQTSTGEVTVRASNYELLAKALRPLPEKWHGLTDPDQIYRQRYLDLIVNQDSRKRFFQRSQIIKSIREFLWQRDFTEVETPILHPIAGGAAARPFLTHCNALNHEFSLRIALELHLKRMLIGGFDRVFELGRVFRNEGIDKKHNPEFTMLELYQAYGDHNTMMSLIKELVQKICMDIIGTTTLEMPDGRTIELGGEWTVAEYKDLIIEQTKDPLWFERTKEEKIAYCLANDLQVEETWEDYEVTQEIYSKKIEVNLFNPTFVMHIAKELCPLAKINQKDPSTIDVFELCINGQEIAPAYSEQNDPFVQRQMFTAQAGEEVQKIDEEFLSAMEYGMPPAGGMGIGIDRLVILLTSAANIRDTILFPSLKPEAKKIIVKDKKED